MMCAASEMWLNYIGCCTLSSLRELTTYSFQNASRGWYMYIKSFIGEANASTEEVRQLY